MMQDHSFVQACRRESLQFQMIQFLLLLSRDWQMMHDHWSVQVCGKEALQFLAEPPLLIPVEYRKFPFQLENV